MGIDTNPRSRRELLGDILKGSLSLGALASLAGCDTPEEDPNVTDTEDTTRIRRPISSLQRSDPHGIIPTFKRAIAQMKNLPASDPRNYQNQVAIHGISPGNTQSGQSPWTECEHWNWLFLPWHRLYITYFEEICRELTGNQDFALPFWNWASNHQLPAIFGPNHGSVTGPSGNNPLYNSSRRPSVGDSIKNHPQMGGPQFANNWDATELEQQVLSQSSFQSAVGGGGGSPTGSGSSTLEGLHDTMHVWVGGDMGVSNSPNDPIFWTHHGMVDCVWWEWNARRGNPNPSATDWVDAIEISGSAPAFETAPDLPPAFVTPTPSPATPRTRRTTLNRAQDFVDAQQKAVTGSAATSLASVVMPLFTFHYENIGKGGTQQPTPAAGTALPTDTVTDELESHLREGAPIELETIERFPVAEGLEVIPEEPIDLSADVTVGELRPVFSGEREGQLLLRASGIQPPDRPDVATLVFVNRPDIFAEPTPDDPGFAGFVVFPTTFGKDETLHKPLNVTRPLRRLDERQELRDEQPVSVQIISLPFDIGDVGDLSGDGSYTIGALDLAVTRTVIDDQDEG
jgi:hypothetical protein